MMPSAETLSRLERAAFDPGRPEAMMGGVDGLLVRSMAFLTRRFDAIDRRLESISDFIDRRCSALENSLRFRMIGMVGVIAAILLGFAGLIFAISISP